MFDSIRDDVKYYMKAGNMVTKLIMVNCMVFIFVVLVKVFTRDWQAGQDGYIYEWLVHENLAISSNIKEALFHPWTFITHMFLHEGPWHLLWNMLWLFWMGRILGDLIGDRKILPTYILGGLFGAVFMMLMGMLLPNVVGDRGLGASAAVSAIILAAATTAPNSEMRFLFIGNIRLKYIALVFIVLELLYSTVSNTGGHFAHLGGAFFGWFSIVSLRRGNSLTAWFENLFDRKKKTRTRNPKMKVAHRSKLLDSSGASKKELTDVDKILEKIKSSGIDSLSKEEKRILDQASKK